MTGPIQFANDVKFNGSPDHLGQHKKALLQLLDQVEDVISVDDSVSNDMEVYISKVQGRNGDKISFESHPVLKTVEMDPPDKGTATFSNPHFLVLERMGEVGHWSSVMTVSLLPFWIFLLLWSHSKLMMIVL